jgi:hypothetical protein
MAVCGLNNWVQISVMQTSVTAHAASQPTGNKGSFQGIKELTTRKREAVPAHFLCVFVVYQCAEITNVFWVTGG